MENLKAMKGGSFGQMLTLFFIRVSSSMAFAVFFSGLSLYLTQTVHYSGVGATAITGLFLSLNYFLPLIGGVFASRVIEYKKLYCLGVLFSFCGCLVLALHQNLFLGLSLFLMNSLVSNVCLNMFVTSMYDKHQVKERRVGFVWNFIGLNLGFLGGYFLTGFSTLSNSYTGLFYLMSGLMLASLLMALTFIKEPVTTTETRKIKFPIFVTVMFMLIAVLSIQFCLGHGIESKGYITFVSILAQMAIINFVYQKSPASEKTNIVKFIGYSLLAVVFWAAYLITPIAMMQFIQNDVDRVIFGISFAPQWIMNIDSLVILLLAPGFAVLLARKTGGNKSAISFFQFGFMAAAFAFFSLYLGLVTSLGAVVIPVLPVLCYLVFLVLGEISINPVGNALIGDLIPESMRGLMTGAWTMNVGIGGLIASYLSSHWILMHVNPMGLTRAVSLQLATTILVIASLLFTLAIGLQLMKISLRRSFYAMSQK